MLQSPLHSQLLAIAQSRQSTDDPSHDFAHIRRVLGAAVTIGESVGADMDIIVPAVLFHDTVVYQKNDPRSEHETEESAVVVAEILSRLPEFPQEKIPAVQTCIRECSFSKGLKASSLESQVLQDADRLEATGAISIMRTCASSGQMNRPFYDPADPFREQGQPQAHASALDLFYRRLLVVEKTMHTDMAKTMARQRTAFLEQFLLQLKRELTEVGEYPPVLV